MTWTHQQNKLPVQLNSVRSRRSARLLRAQLRASVLLSAMTLSLGCSEDGDKLKLRDDPPLTRQDAGQSPTGSNSPTHTPSATQKNSAPGAPSDEDSSTPPPTDGATLTPEAGCGDGEQQPDEACDDGNREAGDGCDRLCNPEKAGRCGDGERGGREQCDDGNRDDFDGCDRFCNIESVCGDEKVEGAEACDPPGSPQCNDKCELSICGNDFVDVGEECDPPGKQCTDTCQRPCGDGTLDPESCVGESCEECDDGNERGGDGCSATCHPESCGNGWVDWNEECDLGLPSHVPEDPEVACAHSCLLRSYCGDGVVGGLEECDPAQLDTLPCSDECLRLPGCGDGILDDEAGEQCDDNNSTVVPDGCDAECQNEDACGDGILAPPSVEECDDGNVENADGCSKLCRREVPPFSATNLSSNPDFNDTTRWTEPDSTIDAQPSTLDVQNSPSSGSLKIALNYPESGDGPVVSGAQYTCLTLTAGAEYELLASYYLDIALPADGAAAGATFLFYAAGSGCTGTIVDAHTVLATDATRGVWRTLRDSFTVPDAVTDTLDVRLRLDVNADEDVSGSIYYDNIRLGVADTAPPTAPICGDAIVNQSSESCDDGNQNDEDGCSDCTDEPACGDGNLDDGEECDDGNVANNDYCSTNCTPSSVCGDNLTEGDEQCDGEPNCTHYCTLRGSCGDGDVTIEAGEECDNGSQNGTPGNACTLRCQVTPVCGDGEVATTELCDDGNTENGDGCSAECFIEAPPPCPAGYIRYSSGKCELYVPPSPSSATPVPTPSISASASNSAPSPSVSSSVSASSSASSVPPDDAGVDP